MRAYLFFLVAFFAAAFLTPQVASAERVIFRPADAYFGDVQSVYVEPVSLADDLELDQQDVARLDAAITSGTKKLKSMKLTDQKEMADLIVRPSIKWWQKGKKTTAGHYETRTYEDDIYEPGHYDIYGRWIEGRSIKVKKQRPIWIPPSHYYIYLLGVDYSVYDRAGKKVYEISYDKESALRGRYDLLQRSARDFFDELDDLKKDDQKKGPSIKQRIDELLQARDKELLPDRRGAA